jgi:hypothetical protein
MQGIDLPAFFAFFAAFAAVIARTAGKLDRAGLAENAGGSSDRG